MTIEEALTGFLAEQRERLTPREFERYEEVVTLLRMYLNGYGPSDLLGLDKRRWQRAQDRGDQSTFCELMSATHIALNVPTFLNYYIAEKVITERAVLRASGTVMAELMRWLRDRDVIDADTADERAEVAEDAARDLPEADRLRTALYKLSEATPVDDPDDAEKWIDEGTPLRITTVKPGELWFEGDLGPVPVPREVSRLAREGWSVSAVLAYARDRWWLVETGNVHT